jgi:hypothetical protein
MKVYYFGLAACRRLECKQSQAQLAMQHGSGKCTQEFDHICTTVKGFSKFVLNCLCAATML